MFINKAIYGCELEYAIFPRIMEQNNNRENFRGRIANQRVKQEIGEFG